MEPDHHFYVTALARFKMRVGLIWRVNMKILLAVTASFAVSAGAASALTVNFENEAPLSPDPTNVGTAYSNGGINFSSTEDMQLVEVGAPANGFAPDDMPVDDSFGQVFLTGDFSKNTDMTLSLGSGIFSSIAFDIVDIDGGDDGESGEFNEEQFTFNYLFDGGSVFSETVTSNDVSGDGTIVNVSYTGLFDTLQITGVTPGNQRNIGWGIDNINATVVPLPAGFVLTLTALGGLGALRARRGKS